MLNETSINYEQQIQQYDRTALLNLWAKIEAGDTPEWEAGRAFEYLVLRAFQLEAAEVRWPYRVRFDEDEIEQIDGAVYSDGFSCLIECKDTEMKVNIEPIAKLRNQLLRRPGMTLGLLFSRSGFTEPAKLSARFIFPKTILLWEGDEIAYALRNRCMRSGLVRKYRHCVEHGNPSYDISEGMS
jgi:hypothetical protein